MNGDEEESSDLPSTPSLLGNGVRVYFTVYLHSASHKKAIARGWNSQECRNLKKKKSLCFFNYFIEPSLTIRDER